MNHPATDADLIAFQEGEVTMIEGAEVAVVTRTAKGTEEISVSKNVSERTGTVQDTIHRTDVDMEQLGKANTPNAAETDTGEVTCVTQ